MESNRERLNNYDLLKIVSMIAVIFIHANWIKFSVRFASYDGTIYWIVESLINIITRFSVPSFVMISGAILLEKPYVNPKDFYKRCLPKLFIPTFLIYLMTIVFNLVWNNLNGMVWNEGFEGLFRGEFYNFWYMFMLFMLYIITPYLQLLRKELTHGQYIWIGIIMLLWAVISQSKSLYRLPYSIGVVFAFAGYYVMGDIIRMELKRFLKNKTAIIISSFVIAVISIVITLFWRLNGHVQYVFETYTNFFSPTITIYSITVFVIFSLMEMKKSFSVIASGCLYVYLFHTAVLKITSFYIEKYVQLTELTEIFAVALITLVISFVLGNGFKYLFKRIRSRWINTNSSAGAS